MSTALAAATIGTCLVLAAVGAVLALLNREIGWWFVGALGALEVLVLAQAVVAIAAVVRGERPESTATFLGYAVGVLFVLPVGVLWSLAERSRWSTLVTTVAALAVAVMSVRMLQMWSGVSG